jgi:3-oxoacyl-[acyl-carrier-protein] synthase III
MASVSSISSSAPHPVQDVARAAKAAGGSPELRQELLGQVAERVANGDYVKAELTAEAAQELAQSSNYRPGQILNKVV